MRLALFGSGSSGNVAFFEADAPSPGQPTRLLVDAGLSKKQIERKLRVVTGTEGLGLALADIDAVLITHEHNDHVGCAKSLERPLFAPAACRRANELTATRVLPNARFSVGAFEVLPVLVPHDADETVGYVLESPDAKVGILTDCGHETAEIAEAYAGCHVLILETNYDAALLKFGPYPSSLKRRVGGSRGHLSNDQAAELLKSICRLGRPPELVVAAHVSQANNRPLLAKSALDRVLGRQLNSGRVIVASQAHGTPMITIRDGRVAFEPANREQLTFPFDAPLTATLRSAS